MDPRGGDVFQVKMADVLRQPEHRRRRLIADAVEMTDIEVQSHRPRVDVLHELQELVSGLDQ